MPHLARLTSGRLCRATPQRPGRSFRRHERALEKMENQQRRQDWSRPRRSRL